MGARPGRAAMRRKATMAAPRSRAEANHSTVWMSLGLVHVAADARVRGSASTLGSRRRRSAVPACIHAFNIVGAALSFNSHISRVVRKGSFREGLLLPMGTSWASTARRPTRWIR